MAEYLTAQFYALNYSLRQRMDILDVSAWASVPLIRAGLEGLVQSPWRGSKHLPESIGMGPQASPSPLLPDLRGWDQRLSDVFLTEHGLQGLHSLF